MEQLVFFYGTLMAAFSGPWRRDVGHLLVFRGRGSIAAALFDLGNYPAAVSVPDSRVRGELYEITGPDAVLKTLDEFEGYLPAQPEASLYTRSLTLVTLEDGAQVDAWAYFYNAPLGRAERIASGDYLQYLESR